VEWLYEMGMRTAAGFYWILISLNLLHNQPHFCTTDLHGIKVSGMILSGPGGDRLNRARAHEKSSFRMNQAQ